jgi:hypothetical protein
MLTRLIACRKGLMPDDIVHSVFLSGVAVHSTSTSAYICHDHMQETVKYRKKPGPKSKKQKEAEAAAAALAASQAEFMEDGEPSQDFTVGGPELI